MPKTITLHSINETITFTKTTKDTSGKFLEIMVTLPNRESGPIRHYHPFQTKYFECIEGDLVVDLIDEQIMLKPGGFYTVPCNKAHTCYPASATAAKFKIVYTPALNFEYIVCEFFESSNRHSSRHASLFDVGYVLTQCPNEFFAAKYPRWLQKIGFIVFSVTGKLLGLVKAKPKPGY